MKYLIASIFSVTVMIETTNTQTKQIQQAQQIEQTQIDRYKKYPVTTTADDTSKVESQQPTVVMTSGQDVPVLSAKVGH